MLNRDPELISLTELLEVQLRQILRDPHFVILIATNSFLFLVVRPGAPSSVLVPSSKAGSP